MGLLDYQYVKIDFVDKSLPELGSESPAGFILLVYLGSNFGGSWETYGTKEELVSGRGALPE